MSDTILYSQNNLEDMIAHVSSLQSTLDSVFSRLSTVDTSGEAGGNYRGGAEISLSGLAVNHVSGGTVRDSIQSYRKAISAYSSYLSDLSRAMKKVGDAFSATETSLRSDVPQIGSSDASRIGAGIPNSSGWQPFAGFPSLVSSPWGLILPIGFGIPGGIGIIALGMYLSSLNWDDPEYKLKSKDKLWDNEDGKQGFNIGIDFSKEAEGSLWKTEGAYEGRYGKVDGSVSVGGGNISGSVGCTLFKDGKFTPDIHAGAEVGIYAAKAEGSAQLGSEDYNVYVKGEGELLGASAEAGVSVGVNGVEVKAGAEAYIAKGEVSGGFTLFGIKFGAKGEAMLGVAAEAKANVSTNDAEGTIKIGPIGITLSIDWSGFVLFK